MAFITEKYKTYPNPFKKLLQYVLDWALTFGANKIAATDAAGNPIGRDTVTWAGITGTFETPGYSALGLEANWTNHIGKETLLNIGSINDQIYGITDIGCYIRAIKTQIGWIRDCITEYIRPEYALGLTVINQLTNESNWTNLRYFDASGGDLQMQYTSTDYIYICVDGLNHRWKRIFIGSGFIYVENITIP